MFLTPIADDLGTTTGPVAALFSTAMTYYAGGAIGGRIGDRFGARLLLAALAMSQLTAALGRPTPPSAWVGWPPASATR